MNDEEKNVEVLISDEAGLHLIKKARRASQVRIVLISIVVVFISLFLLTLLSEYLARNTGNKYLSYERAKLEVLAPNTYIGTTSISMGFLTGELTYTTYALVGNRPVYTGTYHRKYSIFPISFLSHQNYQNPINSPRITLDDEKTWKKYRAYNQAASNQGLRPLSGYPAYNEYNYLGQKEIPFYHPDLDYKIYPSELYDLQRIPANKLVEAGLSFDKSYSINEITKRIPAGITLNWMWVDTFSDQELSLNKQGNPNGKNKRVEYYVPRPYTIGDVFGINLGGSSLTSTISQDELPEATAGSFLAVVNASVNKQNPYYPFSEYYRSRFIVAHHYLSGGKKEATLKDIRIIGVIVSGSPQQLEQLESSSFIKASALGLVVDSY